MTDQSTLELQAAQDMLTAVCNQRNAALNECVQLAAQIQADMADAQRFGVRGTPTFYVNGMQTNFQQLQDTVKGELDKKK